MKRAFVMFILPVILVLILSMCALGKDYIVEIDAGGYARYNTPVSAELKGGLASLSSPVRMFEVKDGRDLPVPSQIEPGKSPRLWWILKGDTAPAEKRIFAVKAGDARQSANIKLSEDKKALQIYHHDSKVLRYNHAIVEPPERAGQMYARGAFIHPLCSPGGEVLTRIHPPDHFHHLGMWNPWTKTTYKGRHIDFWNLGKGEGTVRFAGFERKFAGPVFGGFKVLKEHIDLKNPEGEKRILDEKLQVRVWHQPGETDGYLMDYFITQKNATTEPVVLEKHRYGGMGFRATGKWTGQNRHYLTSEGKKIDNADGSRARWCNVFGKFDDGQAGILFMSHPQNLDYPEPIRIWRNNSNDVFFNFCPVKKNTWTFAPGETLVLKYRLYIYEGSITSKRAEQLWTDFVHPPQSTLAER